MNEETQTPRTLHDRLFKEFLQRFLSEFLWVFFPNEAERLNFATLRFLDKELIINFPEQELRITDIVAEVETWAGIAEAIILHVEVEARDKQTLPQRMSEYYVLLRILRQKLVLPLALVLLPDVGGLCWQQYTETIFGHEVLRFHYGQVGVRDLSSRIYLAENSPIAAALTVLMQPEGESQALIKLQALEKVVESDLSEGDKLFLIEFMNTYAPTAEIADPREEIMQKLMDIEVSWGDRLRQIGRDEGLKEGRDEGLKEGRDEGLKEGRDEGLKEGRKEGEQKMLLHLLSLMFGALPATVITRINAITDEETLALLAKQILTIKQLDELVLPDNK